LTVCALLGEHFGPRAGFAFGAIAAIVGLVLLPRLSGREQRVAELKRPAVPPIAVGETPASA